MKSVAILFNVIIFLHLFPVQGINLKKIKIVLNSKMILSMFT